MYAKAVLIKTIIRKTITGLYQLVVPHTADYAIYHAFHRKKSGRTEATFIHNTRHRFVAIQQMSTGINKKIHNLVIVTDNVNLLGIYLHLRFIMRQRICGRSASDFNMSKQRMIDGI